MNRPPDLMNYFRGTAVLLAGLSWCVASEPRVRPAEWAQPVIASTLDNCFRVSDDLFRSAQPGRADLPDLQALGIKSVITLRSFHFDDVFERSGFHVIQYPMSADSVSVSDLVAVLRQFRAAEKPVLVHCWHGSDRTGFIVAGYRMVYQNWSRESAIAELALGGFGYHEKSYPDITKTLREMDLAAVKKAVFESGD
jgi:protein tyrosine/serine phosphatase